MADDSEPNHCEECEFFRYSQAKDKASCKKRHTLPEYSDPAPWNPFDSGWLVNCPDWKLHPQAAEAERKSRELIDAKRLAWRKAAEKLSK